MRWGAGFGCAFELSTLWSDRLLALMYAARLPSGSNTRLMNLHPTQGAGRSIGSRVRCKFRRRQRCLASGAGVVGDRQVEAISAPTSTTNVVVWAFARHLRQLWDTRLVTMVLDTASVGRHEACFDKLEQFRRGPAEHNEQPHVETVSHLSSRELSHHLPLRSAQTPPEVVLVRLDVQVSDDLVAGTSAAASVRSSTPHDGAQAGFNAGVNRRTPGDELAYST